MRRPDSIPEARRAMREALQGLNDKGKTTNCQDRPVPFADVRQTPDEAAELCGECPLLQVCGQFGYTEGSRADDMVFGGLTWRKGLPLISEAGYEAVRGHGELQKIKRKKIK